MFCEISQDLQIWNIPWPLKLSILVEWPTYVSWKFHSSDPPHEAMTTPSAQTCGALNLPYLWFNFIRRKWWSRTVVSNSIESCWEQLNMVLLLLCTGAVKAVLKLRLQPSHLPYHISEATFTAKSSSISYPPARHTWSSVVRRRINTIQDDSTARTPGWMAMANLLLNADDMLLRLRPLLCRMIWSLAVHNLHTATHASAWNCMYGHLAAWPFVKRSRQTCRCRRRCSSSVTATSMM